MKNPGRGWSLFFNGIKNLPVILERSEESRQRIQVLNAFSDILCLDSSLLITICFLIFHFFMHAYHRSRMTAGAMWFSTVLNTGLSLSHAGFFTKSHIMFFLPSSFRFLPPLKNDGRGVRFFMVLHSCLSFIPCRILR